MPVVNCICGKKTNSMISDWWKRVEVTGKRNTPATKCFARHETAARGERPRWYRGCAYDKLEAGRDKRLVDDLISATNPDSR